MAPLQPELAAERDQLLAHYADLNLTSSVTVTHAIPAPAGGGFADIYKGYYNGREDGETLAVKFIRSANIPKTADKVKFLRKLRQELSVWRTANHENIHRLLGVTWELSWPFPALVSAWQDNSNMTIYLDNISPETPVDKIYLIKLNLLDGVLHGLAYLHDTEVIHADVKGTNVLVSSEGKALLCDFGVSWTAAKRSVSFSFDRLGKGTPEYMAPEFFTSDDPENVSETLLYTMASDVWAFGCLLHEVIHDSSHWAGRNDHQVALALASGQLFRRPDDMDDKVWSIVSACCALIPAQRPSIASLILQLKDLYPATSTAVALGDESAITV